jgi:sugar O-acyltransferase (sialic acid O-acetyltransferase NeuD family)
VKKQIAVVGSDLELMEGIVEDSYELVGYYSLHEKNYEFDYLGSHKKISALGNGIFIILAIDDPGLRKEIFNSHTDKIETYISKDAYVSKSSKIAAGAVIYRNVFVGPGSNLGRGSKLAIGAQIHHETNIGDFCVIGPGARLLGRSEVKNESFLGANSTVGPGLAIGSRTTIGMGAVVTRDILENKKAWGVPAKPVN